MSCKNFKTHSQGLPKSASLIILFLSQVAKLSFMLWGNQISRYSTKYYWATILFILIYTCIIFRVYDNDI